MKELCREIVLNAIERVERRLKVKKWRRDHSIAEWFEDRMRKSEPVTSTWPDEDTVEYDDWFSLYERVREKTLERE